MYNFPVFLFQPFYFRGAINSYGFPLYGLGEFPDWADPLNEQNCTISIANITSASLPNPLAALSQKIFKFKKRDTINT